MIPVHSSSFLLVLAPSSPSSFSFFSSYSFLFLSYHQRKFSGKLPIYELLGSLTGIVVVAVVAVVVVVVVVAVVVVILVVIVVVVVVLVVILVVVVVVVVVVVLVVAVVVVVVVVLVVPVVVIIVEGSLNSKLPTIWRVEKQMRQAVKSEGRRCTSAKVRRKKIHQRQMLEKLRNAVFFQ